MWVVKA